MAKLTGRLDGKPANPAGVDNRRVIFNFPVATPELLAEVANARTIDLPRGTPAAAVTTERWSAVVSTLALLVFVLVIAASAPSGGDDDRGAMA
jgi:hypothetical protein